MNAEILCVGTELLLGGTVNTNATYLSKGLAAIGVSVYHHSVVGDNPQRLKDSLNLALSRADLVILTGGLGPTYDDLTKEMVAEYFHREMQLHEESLQRITEYFHKIGREMTENNKKQALMPKGAVVFQNNHGTAPGLAVEEHGKMAILLPGPPREMQPMFDEEVLPFLQKRSHVVFVSQNIHIFGMGESKVESILKPLMLESLNPTVAPYAKDGEVMLRVTASARDEQTAHAMTKPMVEKICGILGDVVYGVDIGDLQTAAVKKLKELGLKVATSESCTGGFVSKRLTEVPGSSAVFECGVCSYANRIKEQVLGVCKETLEQYGAVSRQTAQEMAQGVRKLAGADIGISTTGIAGPDGGTKEKPVGLVYVGVDSAWYSDVIELHLSRGRVNERDLIRYLAASHALDQILKACKAYEKRQGTLEPQR
ncbi:MAG TPA: competence/damage-inducible protein A [Firmicutes bacterium]|mgnify:CR=1 FL=1|nr:competence/damage-inducible protein A [Bacillota bacterium]